MINKGTLVITSEMASKIETIWNEVSFIEEDGKTHTQDTQGSHLLRSVTLPNKEWASLLTDQEGWFEFSFNATKENLNKLLGADALTLLGEGQFYEGTAKEFVNDPHEQGVLTFGDWYRNFSS